MINLPENLKYTKEHEWIKIEKNGTATIGITDFAQKELGDIVYVDVDSLNESISKDEVFGSIEAVKTVSDLFMPIRGKIISFNEKLEETPEMINQDPYGEGWIIKIKMENENTSELLDKNTYSELIKR